MKKLNNLTEIIDKNLKNIIITDPMKEQISSKIKKTSAIRFKRIKACVTVFAVMFLAITVIGNSNNTANAFNLLIKYIPGINSLVFDNKNSGTYALDSAIAANSKDGTKHVEILSCFTDGNIVKIDLKTNFSVNGNNSNSISAIDKKGNNGKLIECNMMGGNTLDSSDEWEWIGTVKFEFNNIVDKFDVELGGFKIPVSMSKIEGISDFKDFGDISYANGIRVAALTNYSNNLLEVKIIGLSDDGKKILNFANGNVYIIDKLGNHYSPVSSPNTTVSDNTFYFDAHLKDDLKLIVPYIILTDNKKINISLEIPPIENNSTVDLPFAIGNYDINIIKLQRTINNDKFALRQVDGRDKKTINYSTNGLQIVVDKKFDSSIKDGLYDFSYTCDNEYLSIPDTVDGKKVYYYPGNDSSDKKYSDSRYKTINLPNFPLDQKSLDIKFTDPQYYRKGDWIITLSNN